jgi:N-acetylmuramoyl-L-alanine amidase
MRRLFTLLFALIAVVSQAQLQGKVICIDPGHPSEVGRGTKGKKLTEMQVVWNMALLVKARLEKMGAKVVLTKSHIEQLVRNRDRAEVANRTKADLMLRLHCDAAAGSGFATYYPTQKGKSQGVTGPSNDLLKRLKPVAERFHRALSKGMSSKLSDHGLKSDLKTAIGGRQGALTGSIFSKEPVVLVELVVLTNPKDEAFIASQLGQKAFADALAKAVVAALDVKNSVR